MNVINQKFEIRDSDYFELVDSSKIGFNKLTDLIKVESARESMYKDKNITQVIRSRKSVVNDKGKRIKVFFTGLIPTSRSNCFIGDNYEVVRGKPKRSFILFEFAKNGLSIVVHYLDGYTVYPSSREKTMTELLNIANRMSL